MLKVVFLSGILGWDQPLKMVLQNMLMPAFRKCTTLSVVFCGTDLPDTSSSHQPWSHVFAWMLKFAQMSIHAIVVDLSRGRTPCSPCATNPPVKFSLYTVFCVGAEETSMYFINKYIYILAQVFGNPGCLSLVMSLLPEWSRCFSFNLSFSKHLHISRHQTPCEGPSGVWDTSICSVFSGML